MKRILRILLGVGFSIGTSLFAQSVLLLKDGNVLDIKKGTFEKNVHILIEDGKILQLTSRGKKLPEDIPSIDVSGKWIIPGLIDSHIHFFQSGGLYARPDALDLTYLRTYEEERKMTFSQVHDQLLRYLRCGITTVADMGGPFTNFSIRDTYLGEKGMPEILVTGPLIATYQPSELAVKDPPIVKVNSPEEAILRVREQLPFQPDYFKIWYIVLPGQSVSDHLPVVRAVIEEAHRNRLKVAVHATELNTALAAVKAGADLLVHSISDQPVSDELLWEMARQEVSYMPTLSVRNNYYEVFTQQLRFTPEDIRWANPFALGSLFDLKALPEDSLPPTVSLMTRVGIPKEAKVEFAHMQANLQKVQEAGIRVVTGTDAGNIGTFHAASYLEELQAMEAAGLSRLSVLQASTLHAAEAFGRDELGCIDKGNKADLLVLNQNPLESLAHLRDIHLIIKDGVPLHPDSLLIETPEQVVQRQLNAYNYRDLEGFLATYHDSVEIFNHPHQLILRGKQRLRDSYGSFFEQNPDLHAEILNRMVVGNQVIDKEKVTGLVSGRNLEAIAIYQVENGLIRRVFFVRE